MRIAIITGVSHGVGEALAIDLLARDFRVLGIGRNPSSRLEQPSYAFVRCDLAEPVSIAGRVASSLAAIAAARPSGVYLINNAATIEAVGVLGDLDAARIVASIDVNLAAPIVLANLFCNAFRDDAIERRIINVSSGAAQSTLPGEALYCVAKAGLEMLTRSLADEIRSPRFAAITLRPGIIDTPMQAFARSQPRTVLPSVDLFKGFHAGGQLQPPHVVARKVVDRLVLAPVENGRTYTYAEL
jgi:NAD(P)-dependent dehydrogenase (short-subunit alcohol dehydrogenase family)